MRFRNVVLVAALMIAAIFILAVSRDWPRIFFKCESFGCIGLGFLYLLICVLVVAAFFVCGVLFGPVPRLSSGLFAGGVATLAMAFALGALFLLNQLQIAQDWKEYDAVCAQHPELCPEKSKP